MATLLFQLVGPMQSWGIQSHFSRRDTGREPSKSGVIGLICAALGRPRTAPLADLASLRLGVRVDCEGVLQRDWHTAQDVLRAEKGLKSTEISERFYLADAVFLAGLEGDLTLLQQINDALRAPVWPLFLGRKAFVPGRPPALTEGLRADERLEQALERWPPLTYRAADALYRFVIELAADADAPPSVRIETRLDHPLSFAHGQRSYLPRRVSVRTARLMAEAVPPQSPLNTPDGDLGLPMIDTLEG